MKILYLTPGISEGTYGRARFSWEVISRVSRHHEVRVLVEDKSGKKEEVACLTNPNSPRSLWDNILVVRKFAKDFDLIHALDGWPYALYARFSGLPYVVSGIGTYSVAPLEQRYKSWFLKNSYKKAKKLMCISKYTRDEIAKRVRLNNLDVVHLGVDHSKFRNLNLQRQPHLLVGVGEVKYRKGYHTALKAVRELKEKYPDVKYVIVGSFEKSVYTENLKAFIKENNMEKNVEFRSNFPDEELVKLYNEASAFFLMPTNDRNHFEGFGLVFLEAAACGLPVIGTYGNGDEDAVAPGKNGFLVPQNDPAAAARDLDKLFSQPQLMHDFGSYSLDFAANFTWDNTVAAYLKAYNQL